MKGRKKMKRLIYKVVPLIALVIGVSGCKKDFLDRKPLGQYTMDDLSSGSVESQVFAAYGGLRKDGLSGLPFIAIHNIRSDDADKGSSVSDGTDSENYYDNFQYTTDHWLLDTYWTDHYNLINLCNNVISTVDSLPSPAAATLVNRGEAKFLRAYAYFNLVRAFGEVPKIDFKVTNASQANVAKSTVPEIYQLIDADLQEAAAVLPASWGTAYPGRLTSGAAKALQAKTYLYRQNWAMALASAKAVMSSGQYDLSVPYDQIFTEAKENSKESVFEIQAVYTPAHTDLGITYASRQGVRGEGSWNLGWGWNTPTQSLADAFETGDPRKDATLLYSGQVNAPYGENVPAATATVPRPYWNKKVYTNPAIRVSSGSLQGEWFDLRIIRYSDVVLMAAEAANELGGAQNIQDALSYLEKVRARARGNNSSILPMITTTNQSDLRNAIRHERRVELGMENERFFDLVRWGIAEDVLHAAGKTNYQYKNRYLPIPQPEVDKSGGMLKQNPDYK